MRNLNKSLLIGLVLLLGINMVFADEISLTNLKDAYGYAGDPTTNINSNTLYFGSDVGVGTPATAYITFNSSEIPVGAVIISATLGLYNYYDEDSPTSNVYHLYNDWQSNDGSGILSETQLTWNNQPCGTAFDNNTNCNLTILDSVSTTGAGWITFDVTEALNSNSDDILSLALNGTGAGGTNTYHQTWSRDYVGDPSLRPYLNVTYTMPYTISYDGGYVIYTYTDSGTFNVPTQIDNAEILIVGGGGAGGGSQNDEGSGGGGAGGLVYGTNYNISAGLHNITIGLGGISIIDTQGGNGGNTSFDSIIAFGGGGGGKSSTSGYNGKDGGSGGGTGNFLGSIAGISTQINYTGLVGYGNMGGATDTGGVCGGGGGASESGENSTVTNVAGNGGNGTCFNITGTTTCYAGGGGGAYTTAGAGGLGGGGHGCDGNGATYKNSSDGVNGTGGGGGGEGWCDGTYGGIAGHGGSGIVIIRFFNSTPTLNIDYPTNTTYSNNVTRLNYTVTDATTCKYSLNGGITNTTITCGNNITGLNSGNGSHTWTVYASNDNGEVSDSVTFTVNPLITCTVIPSSNYTISGGRVIAVSNSPYLGDNVNVTYDYDYKESGLVGEVVDDTSEAIAGTTSWFAIIITIVVMVVLITLTILIISVVKKPEINTA